MLWRNYKNRIVLFLRILKMFWLVKTLILNHHFNHMDFFLYLWAIETTVLLKLRNWNMLVFWLLSQDAFRVADEDWISETSTYDSCSLIYMCSLLLKDFFLRFKVPLEQVVCTEFTSDNYIRHVRNLNGDSYKWCRYG